MAFSLIFFHIIQMVFATKQPYTIIIHLGNFTAVILLILIICAHITKEPVLYLPYMCVMVSSNFYYINIYNLSKSTLIIAVRKWIILTDFNFILKFKLIYLKDVVSVFPQKVRANAAWLLAWQSNANSYVLISFPNF